MTPAEARADLLARLDAAQQVLGGEWVAQDDTLPDPCNDEAGYFYHASRTSNRPAEDLDAVTEALKQAWKADGMTVGTSQFDEGHRGLSGESPEAGKISYTYSVDRIILSADGPCREGDWLKIYKEEGAKLLDTPAP